LASTQALVSRLHRSHPLSPLPSSLTSFKVYCGTSTRSPLDDQLPRLHRHSSSPDNSSPASVSRRGSKPPPWTLYNSRARYLACDDRLCIFHLIAGPTDRYQAIARAFAASTVDTTRVSDSRRPCPIHVRNPRFVGPEHDRILSHLDCLCQRYRLLVPIDKAKRSNGSVTPSCCCSGLRAGWRGGRTALVSAISSPLSHVVRCQNYHHEARSLSKLALAL
jgi:hypothetical protein